MRKFTILLIALLATTTIFAQLATVTFNSSMPSDWTYIPSKEKASFYSNGGLKLKDEGRGIQSPVFSPQTSIEVEIKSYSLNKKKSAGEGTEPFTITALNADSTIVATAHANFTKTDGDSVKVILNGEGIVRVNVIMTKFPAVNGSLYNVSLKGVTVSIPTSTSIENTTKGKLNAFVNNNVLYVNAENSAIRMYSITGSLVLNSMVNNGQVDLKGLDKGIYIINVNNQIAKIAIK